MQNILLTFISDIWAQSNDTYQGCIKCFDICGNPGVININRRIIGSSRAKRYTDQERRNFPMALEAIENLGLMSRQFEHDISSHVSLSVM